jgi:hypothetical protein
VIDPQAELINDLTDDQFLELLGPAHQPEPLEAIENSRERTHPTRAEALLELAADADLFHTPEGIGYATLHVGDHTETWSIQSRWLTRWLQRRFFESFGRPAQHQAVTDALSLMDARAQFDGPEATVSVRVGQFSEAVYLDLGNAQWDVIQVDSQGWRILRDPPVRFRRPVGLAPLQVPESGGALSQLMEFVNVSPADWALLTAWLVAVMRPHGPYPVLVLQGEQGSAKSTTARLIRSLVDPSIAPLRTLPRSEQDLLIAADNSWILAFDNLSSIPEWFSDALCRVATGGGFATRALYTDRDEVLFQTQRPIVLNGIDELASRDDLRDRAIILNLPAVTDRQRQEEATLWTNFRAMQPRLLGALLDQVSAAIRELGNVQLEGLPRMADFAKWAVAAERGSNSAIKGTFLGAYINNRSAAVELGIEFDPVANAVRHLAEAGEWEGTATELLARLGAHTSESAANGREWPKGAQSLSNRLRRVVPALRAVGVELEFWKDKSRNRSRLIRIRPLPLLPPGASKVSAASRLTASSTEPGFVPEAASGKTYPAHPRAADATDASDAATHLPYGYTQDDLEREAIMAEGALQPRSATDAMAVIWDRHP